jgi:hypothetical protein
MDVKIIDGHSFPYPTSLNNYPNDRFMKLMSNLESAEASHENVFPLLGSIEDIDRP